MRVYVHMHAHTHTHKYTHSLCVSLSQGECQKQTHRATVLERDGQKKTTKEIQDIFLMANTDHQLKKNRGKPHKIQDTLKKKDRNKHMYTERDTEIH